MWGMALCGCLRKVDKLLVYLMGGHGIMWVLGKVLFSVYSIENLEILAKKIEFFSKKPSGVPRNPSFPV
jgi:hypothetical protein